MAKSLPAYAVQRLGQAGSCDIGTWRSDDPGTTNYALTAERDVLLATQPGGSVY